MKKSILALLALALCFAALVVASPTLAQDSKPTAKKTTTVKAAKPWSKTASGLKYDTSKFEAKTLKLKGGGELVVVASKDEGDKPKAEPEKKVGLSCSGCESCDAVIDTGAGTVDCRSLGCSPCEPSLIVGTDLGEELKKVEK